MFYSLFGNFCYNLSASVVLGEEWVLQALEKAFPNTKVALVSSQGGSGDILLKVNDRRIMFEVKNYAVGKTVKGQNKGKELEKFFQDASNASYR